MSLPTAPTMLLVVAGLALVLGRWVSSSRWYEWIWLTAMLATVGMLATGQEQSGAVAPDVVRNSVWQSDPLAIAGQSLALAFGLIFGIGSFGIRSSLDRTAERFGFLSFLVAAVMCTAVANDLVTLALSLEIIQCAGWSLRKVDCHERLEVDPDASGDSNFRWSGIAASGCLWLGMALLVNVTASTQFDEIRRVLTDAYVPDSGRAAIGAGSKLGLLAIGLIISGLGFRIGLVPWQAGLTEGVGGVGYWTAGVVLIGGQLAGALSLARLSGTVWIGYRDEVLLMLTVVTLLTNSVVAGLAGLGLIKGEGRLRRLLTSLLMLHGAWITVGVMAAAADLATTEHSLASAGGQPGSLAIVVLAVGSGVLSLSSVFLLFSYLSRPDRDIEFMDELLGLWQTRSVVAICLLTALASIVGQPPLLGFWSNWLLMVSGLNVRDSAGADNVAPHPGLIFVLVTTVIATLMTAAVVIRVARLVMLEEPISRPEPQGRRSSLVVSGCCSLLLLGIGLYPAPLLGVLATIRTPATKSRIESPAGKHREGATADVNSASGAWPAEIDHGAASSSTNRSPNQAGPPSTAR